MSTTAIETSTTTNLTTVTKQQQSSSGLSPTTRWGCRIPIYPGSLAPKSLEIVHTSSSCRCHGREEVIVKDYILRWVSYRIDELKEHPVKATTWRGRVVSIWALPGRWMGYLIRLRDCMLGMGFDLDWDLRAGNQVILARREIVTVGVYSINMNERRLPVA